MQHDQRGSESCQVLSQQKKERKMLSIGQQAEYLWKSYLQLWNTEDYLKGYCKFKFSVSNKL